MYLKMLINHLKRERVITAVLFLLMLMASLLAAGGTRMLRSLTGAMDHLFLKANTAHYVQFHKGSYDEAYVRQWTSAAPGLKEWSVQQVLTPMELSMHINQNSMEMDLENAGIYFAVQNDTIDILLDMENEKLTVSEGNIALPVYYKQRDGLRTGDIVTISFGAYEKSFVISDFTRDSQYGNPMITPKRLILSPGDYREMAAAGAPQENIFCFVLKDESLLRDFSRAYQASDMPQDNFMIDIIFSRFLIGITDGIIVGLMLLCSLLLVLVTFLTLRYTILSSLEADYREIGTMKAIGCRLPGILRLYLIRYLYLLVPAGILGLMAGQPLSGLLSGNLLLYLGAPEDSGLSTLLSAGSVLLIIVFTLLFCFLTLLHIGKMNVMDAIRQGNNGESDRTGRGFSLAGRPLMNVNVLIGVKDVLVRLQGYGLLWAVFFLCTFLCILPVHVRNTLGERNALGYFGFPVADLYVSGGNDLEKDREELTGLLEEDPEVLYWNVQAETYTFAQSGEGEWLKFRTVVGDQEKLGPVYASGGPPVLDNEIALSWLAAADLGKGIGDSVLMEIKGEERYMMVTGLFSDMSNGGRAIRACYELDIRDAYYWQAGIRISGDGAQKAEDYQEKLPSTKAVDLETIRDQMLGEINRQIGTITLLITVIATGVSVLITALFIKMLTAREASQIAIMKSLGFTAGHIRFQYFVRVGLILLAGTTGGTLAANLLGEKVMNMVCTMMGAVIMKLIIRPWEVYLLYPLTMMGAVGITVLISCGSVRRVSVSQMNAE